MVYNTFISGNAAKTVTVPTEREELRDMVETSNSLTERFGLRKTVKTVAVLAGFLGFAVNTTTAQNTYTVTESGGTFEAVGGTLTASTSSTVQDVIDDIRTDAAGNNCTVQFGDGTDVLDIGTASVNFENTPSESWGMITLTGKITSSGGGLSGRTLLIRDGVSANSQADISNTAATNGCAFYNYGAGTVTISAGTISATNGGSSSYVVTNQGAGTIILDGGTITSGTNSVALLNDDSATVNIVSGTVATTGLGVYNMATGTVNISGGTVSATSGSAVYQSGTGTVNISGGRVEVTNTGGRAINNSYGTVVISGTALVTSPTASSTNGTIYNSSTGTIKITGGTVESTSPRNINARTIYNVDTGTVDISGGLVKVNAGYAIHCSNANANLTIGGTATIFAWGEDVDDVINHNGSSYSIDDDALVVAWNEDAGTTTYTALTSDDIFIDPTTATAVWSNQNTEAGIAYSNGTNNGFIAIADVAVDKATPTTVVFPTTAAMVYDPAVTLASVSLVGGSGDGTFDWEDATIVPAVGNTGYNAVFTPNDTDNYDYTGINLMEIVLLDVSKAGYDMNGITFPNDTVTHDGQSHSILIIGTLPNGVSVAYTGNAQTAIGEYDVTATFSVSDPDNYEIPTAMTAKLVITAGVGIVEMRHATSVQVYPNPTNGLLFVRHCGLDPQSNANKGVACQARNDGANVEIYDVVGTLLQSKIVNLQSEIVIDISHLAAGLYFLKVDNKVIKVVKE